jgi:SAM-dependent methyltransferase
MSRIFFQRDVGESSNWSFDHLTDDSRDVGRRTLEGVGDLHAQRVHKTAPLQGCTPALERQQILAKLLPSTGLLLDVGCWDGSFQQFLQGINYIGIDINRQPLEKARLKKLDVIVASCDFLPFRSELFDACSLIEVIEHLYSPEKVVREIHRILKPSGVFVLATPNFVNFVDRINVLLGKNVAPMDHQHIRFFTWRTLNQFLRKQGFAFEVRRTWFLPFPARRLTSKYQSWRGLMKRAARLFPNFDECLLGRWRKVDGKRS